MKCCKIESLEPRQLLAFSSNINFQPDGVTPPSGYRVDTGAVYGLRANGMTYGWSADNRANARDRNANSDQRFDTLNHMQIGGNRSWEISVPNGRYQVRLVAGDPSFFDSILKINVEGALAINKTTSSGSRFADATVTVNVTDGRLTLSNATGARNNKINFAEIRQVENTQPPTQTGWTRGPDLPIALGEVAGGVIGNKLYIVGDGSGATLSYDLSSRQWSSSLAQRPHRAKDQLAEVINNKLYVFGGIRYINNVRNFYNYVQIYDPATNKWTLGAPMPFKSAAGQSALINGQVYLAGGITEGNVTTNRVARYNPSTNSWTNLANMPGVGRNSAPTGTDGSRMYLFGGRVGGDNPENGRTDILVYNPSSNGWSTLSQTLPLGRGGTVKAPFVNGEFVIMGGENTSAPLARVDFFQPTTGTFRRGPDMPTPRHGIYPIAVGRTIHVPGGGVVAGYSNSRVFESLSV